MKLCLSLDMSKKKKNLSLANSIKSYDIWLKVGFRSFIRDGKSFLEELKSINNNFKIFLDLKLYDIPNTMTEAGLEIANMGLVDMFNIHISSGSLAIREIISNMPSKRPLILGVTALTSFDDNEFFEIYNKPLLDSVINMSKIGFENGLDGVVCSAYESKIIKDNTSQNFITLTPGIRPFGESSQDQKRVANISFAKESLVDFIVVGRPIYENPNPQDVVKKILEEINC
jgi:orotidine-5'-phosphate decarboxylase